MNNQSTINKNGEIQPKPVQRNFMIGDEWLYYKFYTGPKTADVLLTEMVKPLCEEFLKRQMIDRWFFIRYSDPGLHTRVRFHICDLRHLTPVILAIKSNAERFIRQSLVWKVQVDTYQREIERYGSQTMALGEEVFFHDSQMIVDMLSLIEGDEGERIRWLFGLRAIDSMLDDFLYDMERKYELVSILRENFGREHGMNRSLKEQMEKKFRADRAVINELMDHDNDEKSEMLPLFQLIARKSSSIKPAAEKILALNDKGKLEMPINDLMASYSHMMINRLFKSKQRTHEMVLYDFLHRYYKSEIARRKYSKINAQKKAKK
jgi:thiopeptide-type bacteriocin biosynthesis protein